LAFTLIELLISIAIISLLIAILVPALSGSRTEARKTQCLSRLRELYLAHAAYVQDEHAFPPLNNEPDEGAWQYNYLIWDGQDYDSNFGPLVHPSGSLTTVDVLYCPVQQDLFYTKATPANPWPPQPLLDTRSSYARRYHLSGKDFSQLRTIAFVADVLHLPGVIESGHQTGVNVAFSDGHARWVKDPGILRHNDLHHPFDPIDNPIMEDIWETLDGMQ